MQNQPYGQYAQQPQYAQQQPQYAQQQQPQYAQQQQQYQPQPQMSMTFDPKNAKNLARGPDGKRKWNHGLCDCCGDCGTCCCATFCGCCTYGKSQSKLKGLESGASGGDSSCNCDCCLFTLMTFIGCQCIFVMNERDALQRRYGINGGGCGNCMTASCCMCCAQVQHVRELQDEQDALMNKGRA